MNSSRAAIIQSSYIPWKGYFDIIHDVDYFVFLDDVQYTRRDWRCRNIIKSEHGPQWLTIPLGRIPRTSAIDEVVITDSTWQENHFNALKQSYSKAPYFGSYLPLLEDLYLTKRWRSLSDMNQYITKHIACELGITNVVFLNARETISEGTKEGRLINICKSFGVQEYVSGPAAKNYINEANWQDASILVTWKDYHYPEYPQLYPPFDHKVSILDMLFMLGPSAPDYIWGCYAE